MSPEEHLELKKKIADEIETCKQMIIKFSESAKPVAPDNAIGRLTRMEAINDRSISEASLQSAKSKLIKLEAALGKIDQLDFGICIRCGNPIPVGRIMFMPENVLCVPCAEKD